MRKGLTLAALLSVAALAAKPVSISFKRTPLSSALIELAEAAEINIVADTSRSALGYEPRVTGEWKEAPVDEVLEDIAESLGGAWGWHGEIAYLRQIPWIVTQGAQFDRNVWRALWGASWLARAIIMMRPDLLSTGRAMIPMDTLPPSLKSRLVSMALVLQPLTSPAATPTTARKITWNEFNEARLKLEQSEGRTVAALVDKAGKRIAEWEVSVR